MFKTWPFPSCLLLKVESRAGLAWLKQASEPAGGTAVCRGCSEAAAQSSQPSGCNLLPRSYVYSFFSQPLRRTVCWGLMAGKLPCRSARLLAEGPGWIVTPFSASYSHGARSSIR